SGQVLLRERTRHFRTRGICDGQSWPATRVGFVHYQAILERELPRTTRTASRQHRSCSHRRCAAYRLRWRDAVLTTMSESGCRGPCMNDELTELKDQVRELSAALATLERRMRVAEAYRLICNLQAAYGYYVDKGLWDKAADLFAPDGSLELAGRGVYC